MGCRGGRVGRMKLRDYERMLEGKDIKKELEVWRDPNLLRKAKETRYRYIPSPLEFYKSLESRGE